MHTESQLDIDEILRTELGTINEESDTFDLTNGAQKPTKHVKMGKKAKKEGIGWVFTTQFSLKKSYALFLDRMTSTRSFGGFQAY